MLLAPIEHEINATPLRTHDRTPMSPRSRGRRATLLPHGNTPSPCENTSPAPSAPTRRAQSAASRDGERPVGLGDEPHPTRWCPLRRLDSVRRDPGSQSSKLKETGRAISVDSRLSTRVWHHGSPRTTALGGVRDVPSDRPCFRLIRPGITPPIAPPARGPGLRLCDYRRSAHNVAARRQVQPPTKNNDLLDARTNSAPSSPPKTTSCSTIRLTAPPA